MGGTNVLIGWIEGMVWVFLACFALGLVFTYRYERHRQRLRARMEWTASRESMRVSRRERWVRQWVNWSRGFASAGSRFRFFSDPEDLERNLLRAGRPYRLRVRDIQGLKILTALVGAGFGIVAMLPLFFLGPAAILLFSMLGYFAPLWWLKRAGNRRQAQISREMPDFLDTISITLSAGLSMDVALERYVKNIPGPLSEDLHVYNDEIRLGVPREVALKNLSKRTCNPDVENLVNDLIQAIRLGVPLSKTFRMQAEGMRKIREERAKSKAEKAGPKLALVASLVTTPSILVFILGVLVLNFIRSFG